VQATAVTQVKEGIVAEERLKIAVFIDFDNIQIGVKETLGKDFDVSIVLEALKERGEVVSKVAYGDWPRASEYSREMTQHAIHMVQRSVTPRGDKNGADINLALDALEMAFYSQPHQHLCDCRRRQRLHRAGGKAEANMTSACSWSAGDSLPAASCRGTATSLFLTRTY